MTDRNATSLWLDVQCRKGLTKHLANYLKRAPMLRRESPDEIEDHVSHAYEAWIRRDAFAESVAEGKPPTRNQLGSWAVRIALNVMRDRGTDAHAREVYGARTLTERTTGLQRCVDAVATHAQVIQGSDDEDGFTTEVMALSQRDAEAALLDRDVRRSVEDALLQQSPRSEDAADRLQRVWGLMVEEATTDAISAALGVSRLRATHLTNRVRERLRQAENTVCEALAILRHAESGPVDPTLVEGVSDARRAIRELEACGYVRHSVGGAYAITVAGRDRLIGHGDEWRDRLVL